MKPITIRVTRKKLRAIKLLTAGLMVLAAVLLVESRLGPMIDTITSYQAKLAVTRSINDAVLDVIDREKLDYGGLITLTQNKDGEVSTISTDMIAVNRLKARITNQVASQIVADADHPIDIPLGNLLGNQFLSGRGPVLEFKILPAGYVEVDFYNNFRSAGINQTLHQIMLSVKARVSAVAPAYMVTTDVNTNICVAETVIIGKVPQAYTDINGEKSDLLGMYNDYEAEPPGGE